MARTSPWPAIAGIAALIALPAFAAAQTSSPDEHLTAAKQTLNSIPRAGVTGRHAAKMNDVRRHFAALEKSYTAKAAGSAAGAAARSSRGPKSGNWNTHLIALDRALSDLLGPGGGAASEAAGTSRTTALDSDVRAKLEEFRTHITQFAAAASGASASGSMTSAAGTSSSATPPTSTTPPESTQTAQSAPAHGTHPQPPPTSSTSAAAQADANAAREHLTQARQSLADVTAMPQAQQLQGDTRNKVSQLISQFNQLITTQGDWRSAYNEVNATLTALLSASASATASTSSSTTGAVGTSGTTGAPASAALDPAIRAKLEEFRTRLQAFHSAAGGETAETHIAAIEKILNEASGGGSSATASTSTTGTSGATGTGTLDRAKLEEIRMHPQQLRQSIRR